MLYKDKNKEIKVNIVAKTNDGWLIIERCDSELFSNNVERKIVIPEEVYEEKKSSNDIVHINPNSKSFYVETSNNPAILKKAIMATLPWLIIFGILSLTTLPTSLIVWPFIYLLILWRALSKRGYFK